jgi:hypothetical protein
LRANMDKENVQKKIVIIKKRNGKNNT